MGCSGRGRGRPGADGGLGPSRRHVLLAGSTVASAGAVAGCLGDTVAGLTGQRYESLTIDIAASGVVWSGSASFETSDGQPVSVSVERALGSRSYTLPADIDGGGYDAVYEPIEITVVPQQGVSEADPLVVTVTADDTRHGRARSRAADDPAVVEID